MLIHGNGAFDPGEIAVMQEAFDIAWRFLQQDPVLGGIDATKVRERLARELLAGATARQIDVRPLADRAILAVRRAMRCDITAVSPAETASAEPASVPA